MSMLPNRPVLFAVFLYQGQGLHVKGANFNHEMTSLLEFTNMDKEHRRGHLILRVTATYVCVHANCSVYMYPVSSTWVQIKSRN